MFEGEDINIIDAIEIFEAIKKLFERILEDEMNNFIDSAKVFTRTREVNLEEDFFRHNRWRLEPSFFDTRVQRQA